MNGIKVEELSVNYGNFNILNNINIEFPLNRISIIIGSNGCGKSTLLKSIGRIINYTGNILLDELNIKEINTKKLATKIAILSQNTEIMNGFTVEEIVSYGRYPHLSSLSSLTKKDKEIIDWAIKITDIQEYKSRKIENLSGGQRQKVWIAMALAQETPIILLDEPTTYLDLAHQLEVLELLRKLNVEQNKTIIMVLHDLNHTSKYGDFIVSMKKGEIIKKGTPLEVITNENMKKIFNIDTRIEVDKASNIPNVIDYKLIKNKGENDEENFISY